MSAFFDSSFVLKCSGREERELAFSTCLEGGEQISEEGHSKDETMILYNPHTRQAVLYTATLCKVVTVACSHHHDMSIGCPFTPPPRA